MKRKLTPITYYVRFTLLLLSSFGFLAHSIGQELDCKGTDFWLTFPGNLNLNNPQYSLLISGGEVTTAIVSVPGTGFNTTVTITPGVTTTVLLPTSASLNTSNIIANNGIHVTAAKEITVYGVNDEEYSMDSFLGLPTDYLGTEYINLGHKNGQGPGIGGLAVGTQLAIVATQIGTTVTITPTVTTDFHPAGVPYTITLNEGQTYLLRNREGRSPTDLSGSLITSDKPIAVFGGAQQANLTTYDGTADYIVEQLPPTSAWGKTFLTVPLKTRANSDVFRILASQDATELRLNGLIVATLKRGEFKEITLTSASKITADKPVLVAQYSTSSPLLNVSSDPLMQLVPAYEHFLTDYTICTPPGAGQHFLNIVAYDTPKDVIIVDGNIIPASSFSKIASTNFSVASIEITPGTHHLESEHLPFGVSVYGFFSSKAYGHPGGFSKSIISKASYVSISPSLDSASTGTSLCWLIGVTDQDLRPMAGVKVNLSITGVHPDSAVVTTDSSGYAEFCYTGSKVGKDSITASVATYAGPGTYGSSFDWTAFECKIHSTVTITQQPYGGATNGAVQLSATGVKMPYTFTLNGQSNGTGSFGSLPAGTHSYIVTDASCSITDSFTLTEKNPASNPPGDNDSIPFICPKDTTIMADANTCTVRFNWSPSSFKFPYLINIVSGLNGATVVGTGVYTICYERTNITTRAKDTCCFNIMVDCVTAPDNTNMTKGLKVITLANPSTNSFTIKINSDNNSDKVVLRVLDQYGKLLEVKAGITPNSLTHFGGNYKPGLYVVHITQRDKKITIKLMKQ